MIAEGTPARSAPRAAAEARLSELPGFSKWKHNDADVEILRSLSESGVVDVDEDELAHLLQREPVSLHLQLADLELHDLARRSGPALAPRWSLTNVGAEVATGETTPFYIVGDFASLDGAAVKVVEMEGEYARVMRTEDGEIQGPVHSSELHSLVQ